MVEKLLPTRKGIPDRLVIWPTGRVDFVELKTATGVLSAHQRLWLKDAVARGQHCHVVYGTPGIRAYLAGTHSTPPGVHVWPSA